MLFLLPRNSTEYKPKGRFFWFVFYAMILVLALKHAEGMSYVVM